MVDTFEIDKIEKLLENATNERQRKMYQALLTKAQATKVLSKPTLKKTEPKVVEAVEATEISNRYFQGVGAIKGKPILTDDDRLVVEINGTQYPLKFNFNKREAYEALKIHVKKSNPDELLMCVYPKATHYPQKDKPYELAFGLIGFGDVEREANTFILRGFWQFIAPCRIPVISIHRNINQLDEYKQLSPLKRVLFAKANHVPVVWRDAPVKPFRFNPKLEKDQQGDRYFVEVEASFDGQRYRVNKVLTEPTLENPLFVKVGKEDKSKALKAKSQFKDKSKSTLKPKLKLKAKGIDSE